MNLKDWIASLEARIEALEQQQPTHTNIKMDTIINIEKRVHELEEAFELLLTTLEKVF